jgi:hypothetical protein
VPAGACPFVYKNEGCKSLPGLRILNVPPTAHSRNDVPPE